MVQAAIVVLKQWTRYPDGEFGAVSVPCQTDGGKSLWGFRKKVGLYLAQTLFLVGFGRSITDGSVGYMQFSFGNWAEIYFLLPVRGGETIGVFPIAFFPSFEDVFFGHVP
jgi:hypothetical protein